MHITSIKTIFNRNINIKSIMKVINQSYKAKNGECVWNIIAIKSVTLGWACLKHLHLFLSGPL